MDLRRLRIGDLIAGLAGVVLIVSLFLPWYGFHGTLPDGTPFELPQQELTGWEALAWGDVVLLLAGALGIALVVLTATQRTVAIPIALAAIVTLVALIAVIVLAFRLPSLPGAPDDVPAPLSEAVDAIRRAGVWVAAAAALLEVAGGALSMRDERLSAPGRPTDVTGRPMAAPRPVQTLPAPSAEAAERAAGRERE